MSNLNKSSFVPLSVILFSIANVHAATCTYDNRLYECVPPIRGVFKGSVGRQWEWAYSKPLTLGGTSAGIAQAFETAIGAGVAAGIESWSTQWTPLNPGQDGGPFTTTKITSSGLPTTDGKKFYRGWSGEYFFGYDLRWQDHYLGLITTFPNVTELGQGKVLSGSGGVIRTDTCPPRTKILAWDYSKVDENIDRADYGYCLIPIESCPDPKGNPITVTGVKTQIEDDWRDSSSLLSLRRVYLSSPKANEVGSKSLGRLLPSWMFNYQQYLSFDGQQITAYRQDDRRITFLDTGGSQFPLVIPGRDRLSKHALGYQLILSDGRIEIYNSQGVLQSITTVDGKSVSVTHDTGGKITLVTDQFGAKLTYNYVNRQGPDGLIDPYLLSVTLPDGREVSYETSIPRGLITAVHFPDGKQRIYTYKPNSETEIPLMSDLQYENGFSSTFEYDQDGIAISTQRAGGVDKWTITDQRAFGQGNILVKDPIGTDRTLTYADRGGVSRRISQSQPAGSGCYPKSSYLDYDDNGNVTNQTDFEGHKTCAAFDLGRNLETVRVEGLTNQECNGVLAVNASLPEGSRKVTTTWHRLWDMETRRAEPGKITTFVFNGEVDPVTNSIANCVSGTGRLPDNDNSPLAVLCKVIEQDTTDTNGSQGMAATLTSTPMRQWQYSYNSDGQLIKALDPREKPTLLDYYPDPASYSGADPNAVGHRRGDLWKVTDPVGNITIYTAYDKAGRVRSITNPNGNIEQREYYPRGWLAKSIVSPSGGLSTLTTQYSYEPGGKIQRITYPDGSFVEYSYDSASRLKGGTDSAGNSVEFAMDNLGNIKSETYKDSSGAVFKTLTREFDALGRVQSIQGVQ